ncbi:MAG: L,D-transpeptidase family protein [Pyrinomonadaceae bacterium]
MKSLFAICLILISAGVVARAQPRMKQPASLTRLQIKEAELRLSESGYWAGPVDGILDPGTRSALVAFQKWAGRDVTGKLTIEELDAIRMSAPPKAREIGYEHVEVDLDRQVLIMVKQDGRVMLLPASTGNNAEFVDEGEKSIAYTPRGRFLVYEKEKGWQTGSLGSTYYANFISGGVAIHGSRNVPNEPASHGCIRIPMFAAREVSKLMPVGTIVLVYDRVSFVSAKDWVRNPKLKEAALLSSTTHSYEYTDEIKPTTENLANKKARAKMIRA